MKVCHYRRPTKLRGANVFSCVCPSFCSEGVRCDHYHDALDLTIHGSSPTPGPLTWDLTVQGPPSLALTPLPPNRGPHCTDISSSCVPQTWDLTMQEHPSPHLRTWDLTVQEPPSHPLDMGLHQTETPRYVQICPLSTYGSQLNGSHPTGMLSCLKTVV